MEKRDERFKSNLCDTTKLARRRFLSSFNDDHHDAAFKLSKYWRYLFGCFFSVVGQNEDDEN